MERTDSLYKYTRLEHISSTLNQGVYASNLQSLNDPYEWDGISSEDGNNFKVVCLSRSRNQKLMWSHYADGHRGCSIKIIVPENYNSSESPLKRVEYCGRYSSRKGYSSDELRDSLYVKDKKWNKELEVRAVYANYDSAETPYNSDKYWTHYRRNTYLKVSIIQIDFGCFAHFDSHYLDALIAIRDYNTNHKKKIKVRKYKMSDKRFEFVLDDDFDYIKEIANITNGSIQAV